MPPRKEPKETVVYPASKRKAPPFKPQRPSKVPRIPTTDSESSKPKKPTKPAAAARRVQAVQDDEDDNERDHGGRSATVGASDSDSEEELHDNPLAAQPAKKKPTNPAKAAAPKRKPSRHMQPSPTIISSQQSSDAASPRRPSNAPADPPPEPSQSGNQAIPQPLLIRLLHEHFTGKGTKIDKHAIEVLQKYFEVFVREAIARARLQKKEYAEKAGNSSSEAELGWLELEDLERVAAGMLLDF